MNQLSAAWSFFAVHEDSTKFKSVQITVDLVRKYYFICMLYGKGRPCKTLISSYLIKIYGKFFCMHSILISAFRSVSFITNTNAALLKVGKLSSKLNFTLRCVECSRVRLMGNFFPGTFRYRLNF